MPFNILVLYKTLLQTHTTFTALTYLSRVQKKNYLQFFSLNLFIKSEINFQQKHDIKIPVLYLSHEIRNKMSFINRRKSIKTSNVLIA